MGDVKYAGAVKAGISFGCALALVMSWTANKSFLWALLHWLLVWFYVIYYLITKDGWTWL